MADKLKLELIRPPHHRLREYLGDMSGLKDSMKENGLFEPIVVRPIDNHYQVVIGHRRYMAAIELGWKDIDAVVREFDDRSALEAAIIENLERQSMDPIEEAKAFRSYTTGNGYGSASELARKIKRDPSYIAHRMDLLNLSDEVYPQIQSGRLKVSQAEILAGVDSAKASEMATIVTETGMDEKRTRAFAGYVKAGYSTSQAADRVMNFPDQEVPKIHQHFDPIGVAREHIELSLHQALGLVDNSLRELPEGEELAEWTHEIRYPLHQLHDKAMRLGKKYRKKKEE